MNNFAKYDIEHAAWYDDFYKNEQIGLTPWYLFMLPELMSRVAGNQKILELGCGQSKGLRQLHQTCGLAQENLFGIDQSAEAVKFCQGKLPCGNFKRGDVYDTGYDDDYFDFIMLMEVIEHLEYPREALGEISRILKPGGVLILSFPNYLNFPWLILRYLSEKLQRPSWIVLQPVDKIYHVGNIKKMCHESGLRFDKCIGSNYFPPLLWKFEQPRVTKILNKLRMNSLAFHPILFFTKTNDRNN